MTYLHGIGIFNQLILPQCLSNTGTLLEDGHGIYNYTIEPLMATNRADKWVLTRSAPAVNQVVSYTVLSSYRHRISLRLFSIVNVQ